MSILRIIFRVHLHLFRVVAVVHKPKDLLEALLCLPPRRDLGVSGRGQPFQFGHGIHPSVTKLCVVHLLASHTANSIRKARDTALDGVCKKLDNALGLGIIGNHGNNVRVFHKATRKGDDAAHTTITGFQHLQDFLLDSRGNRAANCEAVVRRLGITGVHQVGAGNVPHGEFGKAVVVIGLDEDFGQCFLSLLCKNSRLQNELLST